jgi:transcriptional regulator with XRE-family HTH domain
MTVTVLSGPARDNGGANPGAEGATMGRGDRIIVGNVNGTGAIGEYLRARRELVRPEDVGLSSSARRRVPGLRGEEVAMLAGVSIDYYIRLEQGRDQHPSSHVLDALARSLQLDEDATAHLHSLNVATPRSRRRARRPELVPPGIQQLLSSWSDTPAYVQGRYLDVLAANSLATAIAPYYEAGNNLLRVVFLQQRFRQDFEDWDRTTQGIVAALRARVGPDVDDPALNELIGELSVRSDRFRQLWARHDSQVKRTGRTRIEHPLVGSIELGFEKLPVPDTDGQILVVYHAAAGSESASRLAMLAALANGPR